MCDKPPCSATVSTPACPQTTRVRYSARTLSHLFISNPKSQQPSGPTHRHPIISSGLLENWGFTIRAPGLIPSINHPPPMSELS